MEKIYDLLVVGAGSAGLSAGIYAGRAMLETLIIEKKQPGGQITNTAEVVNYPAVRHTTGPALMHDMHLHALDFGVEFAIAEIERVDFSGEVKMLYTDTGVYKGRSVIIATGASPRKLGFAGEDAFSGRGVGYCSTCDGEFFAGLDIFVIGGGFAAAEEAIYLTRYGKKVTIVVREEDFTCAKSIAQRALEHPKIEVVFNTEIIEATGDEFLTSAAFRNNQTGEVTVYRANEQDKTFGIFIFAGYEPQTAVFKGHVDMDTYGYILTDGDMQTNAPGVYAAGDLRPKALRQIVTAVADGAIAATVAERYVANEKQRLGIKDVGEIKKSAPQKSAEEEKPQKPASAGGSGLLTDSVARQVSEVFQKLNRDLTLVTVTDPSHEKSVELKDFAASVAQLSGRLAHVDYQKGENPGAEAQIHADKLPVLAFLNDRGEYTGVKFHGIPGGHELNSFVLAVYNLAGPGQALSESDEAGIRSLENPLNVKVCISLACHLCPDVVVAAQRIAMLNPKIETEMLDIALFPDIRQKYGIMSVPAVIVNDDKIYFGAKKMEGIIGLLKNH